MEIKALLFDKDGTLLDLDGSWAAPMEDSAKLLEDHFQLPGLAPKLLKAGGWNQAEQRWERNSIIAFDSSEAMFRCWQAEIGKPITEELITDIRKIVQTALLAPAPIVEHLGAVIEQLANQYILGVASMDDEINVAIGLKGLSITDKFAFVCGADSGHGHKPDTGMLTAFCDHINVNAGAVAVIGDSPKDLLMARQGGALAIGVRSGGCGEDQLAPYADLMIDDVSQLAQALNTRRNKTRKDNSAKSIPVQTT